MALLDEELTEQIIGCAIRVHKSLGPGLLESVYETCLAHELAKAGLTVQRQIELPIVYDGIRLECGFRIDLLVSSRVVVELKCVEKILPVHEAQLLTYLKLSNHRTGLILNFFTKVLSEGIHRRVL
ncbi:MAG: GxxExxY protein [Phycisphaerales bacterium]